MGLRLLFRYFIETLQPSCFELTLTWDLQFDWLDYKFFPSFPNPILDTVYVNLHLTIRSGWLMSFYWALHSESLDKQEPANQKSSAQIWIKFDSEFIRTRIRSSHPKVFSTEVMSPDIFSHVALIHQDAHGANVLAPFLADIFQRLGLHATTSAPQGLVDYMTSQWINSTTFPPSSRSIYGLPHDT